MVVAVGPSEAQIQAAIVETLVLDGWLVMRVNGGAMKMDGRYIRFAFWQAQGYPETSKGISDLIAWKPGRPTLFVEVKKPGGLISTDQELFLDVMTQAGQDAVIAESVEDLAPWLERVAVQ
jgi:hypothetical protein